MRRPAPKADYLEHTWRLYAQLFRLAHGKGSGSLDLTWRQMARLAGYADDVNEHGKPKVLHSLQRYVAILDELGLVRVREARDSSGRSQRLDVFLLAPASGTSEAPAGPAEGHVATPAPEGAVWAVRRLRAAERRQLDELCQGATAGRLPRRLAPRLQRISNLRTPGGGLSSSKKNPSLALCVGARTRAEAAPVGVDTIEPPAGATPGGCAAGGCAAVAALDSENGARGAAGLDALMASLLGAAARRGLGLDAPELPDLAASLVASEGADPALVVLAAWRSLRGSRGANLSAERRLQLDVALRRLDRYANFGHGQAGAGVRLAVERIEQDAGEPAGERFERLAGVVCWLRQLGRSWRRADLVRRGKLPTPKSKALPDAKRRRPTGGELPWPTEDAW